MIKWLAAHRLSATIIGALILLAGSLFTGWKTSSWYYGAKDKIRTIAEQRSKITSLEAEIAEQRKKIEQHDAEIARRDEQQTSDRANFAQLRRALEEFKRAAKEPHPHPNPPLEGEGVNPTATLAPPFTWWRDDDEIRDPVIPDDLIRLRNNATALLP
jgi:uncharacterized coiled-coil protein SlyX